MNSKIVVTGALIVLLVLFGLSSSPQPCRTGCNVILIMVDTLSGEHLKTYGYLRDTMPRTTAFFENGIIFENATSNAPWTLPSFSSMYFSDLASHITFAELDDDSQPNLPSLLRENGVALRVIRPKGENFIFDTITRLFEKEEITFSTKDTESSIDVAPRELENLTTTERPFFLVVHTFEAHDPYKPHEPYDEYFAVADTHPVITMQQLVALNQSGALPDADELEVFRLRYDQQLAQTDTHLADFLNSIPEEVLSDTVIVFTADHGESFGEHGKLFHASSGLFEEELHIPLMMRVPGAATRRVVEPVSLLDIAPTVLSFMRIPVPDTFIGKSLVPTLNGETLGTRTIPLVNGFPYFRKPGDVSNIQTSLEDAGAAGANRPIIEPIAYGVRSGDQKIFTFFGSGSLSGLHWYDLTKDAEERVNLANDATPPDTLMSALSALQSY